MATIIAIASNKGGVGKSSTTEGLSACLADLGFRVLIVDADSQASVTDAFGLDTNSDKNLGSLLFLSPYQVGDREIKPAAFDGVLHRDPATGIHLLPAAKQMAVIETVLHDPKTRKQSLYDVFSKARVHDRFDFVVCDTPPSLGVFTQQIFRAATHLLIPAMIEYRSYKGLEDMIVFANLILATVNPKLELLGILLNKFNEKSALGKAKQEIVDTIRNSALADKVLTTTIRQNASIAEAPMRRKLITQFAPRSNGAADYMAATHEILSILHINPPHK